MNSPSFKYANKKFMKFKNNYWMLIFHHDYTGKVLFISKDEALNSNKENKYSILYMLNNEYRTMKNGKLKYEFIINWPNLSYYFQWRQTKNPVDENDILGVFEVSGYEPIHVNHNAFHFGGLARDDNYSKTLLNGEIGKNTWCVSIGMLKSVATSWVDMGIPASCEPASVVDLWIKTSLFFSATKQKCRHSISKAYICCFIWYSISG